MIIMPSSCAHVPCFRIFSKVFYRDPACLASAYLTNALINRRQRSSFQVIDLECAMSSQVQAGG